MILKLTRELGVNLAGVEIILNMREKTEAMQQQMESVVATLNQELAKRSVPREHESANTLMPVVQIHSITQTAVARTESKRGGEKRRGWV